MSACGGGGVVVTAMPELFSSLRSPGVVAVAILVKVVPGSASGEMLKTKVNCALSPASMTGVVQVISGGSAGSESVQVKSGPGPFCVAETNVIPSGIRSSSVTGAAGSGPRLKTVTV
jgi:hypothetical protein